GLTVKRIQKLNEALGVSNIDELKAALEAGKVRELPGFGPKLESALLDHLSRPDTGDKRVLLLHALRAGEKVLEHMRDSADLVSVDLAGSCRRWKETVSAIHITASASGTAEHLVRHFLRLPLIASIESKTKKAAAVRLIDGYKVFFSVVSPDEYWTLLHH